MKVLLIWLILVAAVLSAQDALLTLSRSNSCLKDLVSSFVRADDCASLHDQEKAKVPTFSPS